mgnify:FL=1
MAQSITKNGVTMKGSGIDSTTVTVEAGVNEGIDEVVSFSITTTDKQVSRNVRVNRKGKREVFDTFKLSDGTTFNVLKDGIQ